MLRAADVAREVDVTDGEQAPSTWSPSLARARLPGVFRTPRQFGSDGVEIGRVLVRIKSNIGFDGDGIAYTFEPAQLPQGIATCKVVWGKKVVGSAWDIIAATEEHEAGDDQGAGEWAQDFLRWELESGPVGGAGDGGVDIELDVHGKPVIVQCKAQRTYVSPGPVRDLYGALVHEAAEEAWLVTAHGFHPGAQSFARGKPIRLFTIGEILDRRWE